MNKVKVFLGNKTLNDTITITLAEKTNLEEVKEYTVNENIPIIKNNKMTHFMHEIKYNDELESFLYKRMEEYDFIDLIEIFCEKEYFIILDDLFYFFKDCGFKNISVFTNFSVKETEINYQVLENEEFLSKLIL